MRPALAQLVFPERGAQWGIVHAWQGLFLEGGGGNFGGGAAIEDFDQDGDQDVFLGNAAGTPMSVFRNDGNGVFTDISATIGVGDIGTSKQILIADFDNDGRRDLLVPGWTVQTRLFRGAAGGTFEDVSADSGLERVLDIGFPGWATGACAGDIDHDGDLDLHISYWKSGTPSPASANALYRNDGGLHFTDITATAGVADQKKSFQSIFADLDGDGWIDLLVAEDKAGGLTWFRNDQDGTFTDLTQSSGLIGRVTASGLLVDGMGIGIGDYDNDGDPDVYVTNIEDGNVLYRNDSTPGNPSFVERADAAGVRNLRFAWGAGFFDCDDDGWLDLFVVNTGSGVGAGSENRLYENQHDGTFTDIAPAVGVDDEGNGFALAIGDLDADGAVDFLVTNDQGRTLVYDAPTGAAHWLRLRLRGSSSNRDAVGAHVRLVAGGLTQTREVLASSGYLGHDSLELEFGLGASATVDQVEVRWPSGQTETFGALSQVDRSYLLMEGSATPTAARLVSFTAHPAAASPHPGGALGVDVAWQVAGSGPLALARTLGGQSVELARALAAVGVWHDDLGTMPQRDAASTVTYRLIDQRPGLVLGEVTVALPGRTARPRPFLREPSPNPFNPRVRLEVVVPDGCAWLPATLSIVDSRGRRVALLHAGPLPPDRLALTWDGHDDAGRPVPSGAYQAVLEALAVRQATPLVLLR